MPQNKYTNCINNQIRRNPCMVYYNKILCSIIMCDVIVCINQCVLCISIQTTIMQRSKRTKRDLTHRKINRATTNSNQTKRACKFTVSRANINSSINLRHSYATTREKFVQTSCCLKNDKIG